MSNAPDQFKTTPARADGLQCVYGKCQGIPNGPYPCHPGCSFQMTAIDPLKAMLEAINGK